MGAGNFVKIGVIAKVILALLVMCPWSPAAASTAMYTFNTPNFYGNNYYLPQTLGDIFTPAENITVTSLGLFDYQDNGLGEAHEVGIFNQSGALLASALVSAGTVSPLVGHFRYAAIAPLALTAGQTYIVAALYHTASDVMGYANIGKVAGDPFIGLDGFAARYAIGSTTMSFPTGTILASAPFYIGPNFEFTVDPPPNSVSVALFGAGAADSPNVPIPGSVWLLGSGLAGLGWWRCKRT
jgi:Domain of unknown function (DUF4082)